MSGVFAGIQNMRGADQTPGSVNISARLEAQRTFEWIVRIGVFLCIVLGFWYILLVNSLATRGFELEESRQSRTAIMKEVQAWEVQVAIPNSLYALESSEQVQEMRLVKEEEFIAVRDGQVAFNQ